MTIARIIAIILLVMQVAQMMRLGHGLWRSSRYLIQAFAWLVALIFAVTYPNPTFILLLVLAMAVMFALAYRAQLAEREEKDRARARLRAYADANEPGADVIREILKDSEERNHLL